MKKTESDIVSLSIKDFFSSDILKIAILPFIVTMFVVYSMFFGAASIAINNFEEVRIEQTTVHDGVINMKDESISDSIVAFFLKSSAISWLVNILVYSIGSIAMVYVSIFISLIVIGFLTPYILSRIRDKHYSRIQFDGDISIISTILYLVKVVFIMIILFLALIPLYFIPVINIFAINLPFYYLFHKLLNFDVGTTILNKENFKEFKNQNTKKLRLRTLKLYLLSLIPFMSLVLPVYYVVYVGHGYFSSIENDNL